MTTTRRTTRRRRKAPKTDAFLGLLIPLVVVGLAVADFARDGQVDKYLIGALLVFGLGALGWRIDVILEKYLEVRSGYVERPAKRGGDDGDESE